MTPQLFPLPYDDSGASTDNRTKAEFHNIAGDVDDPYRICVMEKGYFYTDNLFIVDSKGYELKPKIDYQCTLRNPEITKKNGLNACAVIVVINPKVSSKIYVDAQMVGGQYCSLAPAIANQMRDLTNNTKRGALWRNLRGKPNEYKPNGHIHALWELYGFTEHTSSLTRIYLEYEKQLVKKYAAYTGDFDGNMKLQEAAIGAANARVAAHIARKDNPHQLTVVQVKLERVTNAPIATLSQAQQKDATILNAYATPYSAKASLSSSFTPVYNSHVNNFNNPHGESVAKLGSWSVTQINQQAGQYYNRGSTVEYTARWNGTYGNLDAPAIIARARSNIPAQNIGSGVMPWNKYAVSAPIPGSVASPRPDQTGMEWYPMSQVVQGIKSEANQILHTGATLQWVNQTPAAMQGALNQITSMLGTNYKNGTMAVWRWSADYTRGTGNGTRTTNISSLGMAVLLNGRWQIQGWV